MLASLTEYVPVDTKWVLLKRTFQSLCFDQHRGDKPNTTQKHTKYTEKSRLKTRKETQTSHSPERNGHVCVCVSLQCTTIIGVHSIVQNSSDNLPLLNSRQTSEIRCCLLDGTGDQQNNA